LVKRRDASTMTVLRIAEDVKRLDLSFDNPLWRKRDNERVRRIARLAVGRERDMKRATGAMDNKSEAFAAPEPETSSQSRRGKQRGCWC